jgi:hypothetical protein
MDNIMNPIGRCGQRDVSGGSVVPDWTRSFSRADSTAGEDYIRTTARATEFIAHFRPAGGHPIANR